MVRDEHGWQERVIGGHLVCAKVYGKPSRFGIGGGRVSKLTILKGPYVTADGWLRGAIYNYDRGLDFDRIGDDGELLHTVLEELGN